MAPPRGRRCPPCANVVPTMARFDRLDRFLGGCFAKACGLPFLVVGLWIGVDTGRALLHSLFEEEWDGAAGVVVRSESTFFGGPEIAYEYDVDGQRHRSDRVGFGPHRMSRDDLLRRFPLGAPVYVRYDARAPDRAVLLPTDVGATLVVLGMGALAAAAGGFLVFGRFRVSEMG